jgi:hypothetical protein
VRAVDHFFPPSNPALPSAPDKKSFSSVSSPISAQTKFVTGHEAFSHRQGVPPVPSWLHHQKRLSPLMAASAAFALKAGLWFRRGRFVMLSPVSGI